jgi:hypothetical protein
MPHQAHNLNNYGRALMSALPQAIAPDLHTNLLNVYIQIANEMGVQQKKKKRRFGEKCLFHLYCRRIREARNQPILGP